MARHDLRGNGDMEVKDLCGILEHLRIMHDAEGAKAQAKDFQKVLGILEGHEDQSIAEFVENMQQLLAKPASSKKAPVLDEVAVKRYVDRLKATGINRDQFEVVYKELHADKHMKKAEVVAVTHGYTGYKMTYGTKKSALDEIRSKFTERARQEARSSIIDKITPW